MSLSDDQMIEFKKLNDLDINSISLNNLREIFINIENLQCNVVQIKETSEFLDFIKKSLIQKKIDCMNLIYDREKQDIRFFHIKVLEDELRRRKEENDLILMNTLMSDEEEV
jgi:hypothetical protein